MSGLPEGFSAAGKNTFPTCYRGAPELHAAKSETTARWPGADACQALKHLEADAYAAAIEAQHDET